MGWITPTQPSKRAVQSNYGAGYCRSLLIPECRPHNTMHVEPPILYHDNWNQLYGEGHAGSKTLCLHMQLASHEMCWFGLAGVYDLSTRETRQNCRDLPSRCYIHVGCSLLQKVVDNVIYLQMRTALNIMEGTAYVIPFAYTNPPTLLFST